MSAQDLGFIHRFRPARVEGQPVLLLLHGTGGDETSLLPLGVELAPEATLSQLPRRYRRRSVDKAARIT